MIVMDRRKNLNAWVILKPFCYYSSDKFIVGSDDFEYFTLKTNSLMKCVQVTK